MRGHPAGRVGQPIRIPCRSTLSTIYCESTSKRVARHPIVHIGSGTLNNIIFAGAIAKIAYCNGGTEGLEGFRLPVLPNLILGRYACVAYFLGSDPGGRRHPTLEMCAMRSKSLPPQAATALGF